MNITRIAPVAALLALAACTPEKLCPADQLVCGGTCTAVATDPAHCGACGVACAAGESCNAGRCTCADGRVDCGGACVDLASDPAHCGACGVACGAGQVCTTSAAGATTCAGACAQASQTTCGAACVDLTTDRWSCGACGRACGTNERCSAGLCVADLYLACYNTDEIREATAALAPAGVPHPVAAGPAALAWNGSALFVASGKPGGAETLTRFTFGPPSVTATPFLLQPAVPTPDLEYVTAHGGLLYVSRSSSGSIYVATPDGAEVDELRLAPAADPNPDPLGVAFVGDKAYVALNARDEVVVLDTSHEAECAAGTRAPPCLVELARITQVALQPLASAGARPMPARVAAAGGRVFVTLWNLDPSFAVPAGGTGRLAVIDPATDALDGTVTSGGVAGLLDLGASCLDPADLAVSGQTLWVTCGAFDYSAYPTVKINGAGVLPVDLSASTPTARPILPVPSGAAPGELAFCSGAGYVGDRNSGKVFRLDPAAGAVGGVELCPPSGGFAYVSDLACGP